MARKWKWASVGLVVVLLLTLVDQLSAQERPTDAPKAGARAEIRFWDPRDYFSKGGLLMWPILACSIATFTFALERAITLRQGRVIPSHFVRRLQQKLEDGQLNRPMAMEMCRKSQSPVGTVFLAVARHWGRPSVEIEQAVTEAGHQQVAYLRRNLRALQGSANLATLLGLLGTILGMIEAFNAVAASQGLGRAEVLASGIAQALLTTAAGLIVAIPSLFLYNYFAGRVERLVMEIDELATQFIDAVSSETLASKPNGSAMPPAGSFDPVVASVANPVAGSVAGSLVGPIAVKGK